MIEAPRCFPLGVPGDQGLPPGAPSQSKLHKESRIERESPKRQPTERSNPPADTNAFTGLSTIQVPPGCSKSLQQHVGSWKAAQNSHDRGSILGVSERLLDLFYFILHHLGCVYGIIPSLYVVCLW